MKRNPESHNPVIDPADQALAAQAIKKKQKNQKLRTDETKALKRVEKALDEKKRWEHYGTIPKRHWGEMSNRDVAVLNKQADKFGIPLRGATIDLPAVVLWLHDFLSENKYQIRSIRGGAEAGQDWETRADADRRRAIARAGREEIRLKKESNDVVDKNKYDADLLGCCSAFSNALKQAPNLLGPMVAGKNLADVRSIIKEWGYKLIDTYFGEPDAGDDK